MWPRKCLKGVGSGASPISDTNKVTLVNALELEGFEVNNEIISKYDSFYNGDFINENDSNDKIKDLDWFSLLLIHIHQNDK